MSRMYRFYYYSTSFITSILLPAFTVRAEGGVVDTNLNVSLENPLKYETLDALLTALLQVLIQVMLPIITIMIIYSGFLFVKARGNQTELSHAKQTFLYTVIGAAVLLGAFVIKTTIELTVAQLTPQ